MPGIVPAVCGTVLNKTDHSFCPPGAYTLMGLEGTDSTHKKDNRGR